MLRVLSQFTHETLPTIRRIQAPFSVLADRGYTFHFHQTLGFHPGMCYDYDVTLIQNWLLRDEELTSFAELCAQQAVVYDLVDPQLLENARVREMLALVRAVTVPNDRIEREVARLTRRTYVLPSVIAPDYFTQVPKQGRAPRDINKLIVGCFGPHDWDLVKPVLTQLASDTRFSFWGDSYAVEVLGELVVPVEVSADSYPHVLRRIDVGLCPLAHESLQDTIMPFEYGMVGKPVIASADSPYSALLRTTGRQGYRPAFLVENRAVDRWSTTLIAVAKSAVLRTTAGNAAHELAKEQRATRLAGVYRRAYDEIGMKAALSARL